MNEKMTGKWSCRSFRHDPIVIKDGKVDGNPDLAIPWAPLGELDVNTDEAGKITGTLTFTLSPTLKVPLKITGHVTAPTDKVPTALEVTGKGPAVAGPGSSAVYKIKGFFIPASDHVVGTVLCMANDLAKQPVGTEVPFVLFPAKP